MGDNIECLNYEILGVKSNGREKDPREIINFGKTLCNPKKKLFLRTK